MMRLWHTALLLLLPLATLPPSGPVQAQAPARDANDRPPVRATIPSGTNVVGGIVVSDNSPARPIRRVVVNLISPDSSVPLSTVTDDDGRFVFDAVPDGTYGLSASKAGWVGAFFGSTRAGHGPGVPLAVRSGERLTDLVLTLTRGAVIAGTVRLPDGRPAENMAVFVSGVQMVAGHPRLRLTGGRSTTDDRGRYRVYGLPAGDYVIQVRPSGFLAGVPTGTTDAPQTTASEVSWAQEVARLRAGRTASTAAGPAHGRTMAYAPVVFPGSADPSRASIVSIAAGEERDGVDFPMVLVPTARISGLVLGPDGLALADARISLTSTSDAPDILALLAPRDPIRSAADGTFSLRAVPPGRYRISARRALDAAAARASSPANGGAAGVRTMAAAGGGDASSGGELWADQDVIVDGEDVSTVTLVTQPGVTLSGRIVFDATTLDAPSDEDVARGKVAVVPVQAAASAAEAIASASVAIAGRIDAGGEFLVVGVVPGRYRLSVLIPGVRPNPAAPGRGWTIRSAMSSGVDLADTALVVESGRDVGGIEVTVTDRAPELIGSLTDAANRPVSGFPIVVFSTNRADWRIGSRRIAVARPATDGTFRLFGLPSGRYYVAAAVDLMQDDLDDPEFYEQLLPGALAITLTEGTRTVQDLRLAP